jgi:beta-lactamase regulating signal transducer with metallopeptidase domain
MTSVFLKLLNMSIAASWLVLAVIALRFLLKKAPSWISCLLWGIVALRLVMPFTIESALSLIPSGEVIPLNIASSQVPAIYSGIPAVNSAVNPVVTQHFAAKAARISLLQMHGVPSLREGLRARRTCL